MSIKHESGVYNNVSIDRASLEVEKAQNNNLLWLSMEAAMFSFVVWLVPVSLSKGAAKWPSVRCRELYTDLGPIAYNDEEEREAP